MPINRSRANASRIYNALLGGTHNFEADRAAAQRLSDLMPAAPIMARLNRAFLLLAVQRLVAAGFTCYLDLATGVPAAGYIHELVPPTAKVLYNDIDPETVAYSRELLRDQPHVRYVQGDMREIKTVLSYAAGWFGAERRVGICLVGAAYFVDDAALAQVLAGLYEWAGSGSQLAISFARKEESGLIAPELSSMYQRLNSEGYGRSLQRMYELLGPWQALAEGLAPLGQAEPNASVAEHEAVYRLLGGMFYKP